MGEDFAHQSFDGQFHGKGENVARLLEVGKLPGKN